MFACRSPQLCVATLSSVACPCFSTICCSRGGFSEKKGVGVVLGGFSICLNDWEKCLRLMESIANFLTSRFLLTILSKVHVLAWAHIQWSPLSYKCTAWSSRDTSTSGRLAADRMVGIYACIGLAKFKL